MGSPVKLRRYPRSCKEAGSEQKGYASGITGKQFNYSLLLKQ